MLYRLATYKYFSGAEDHFIQEGDIKVEIEPDINQMMSQYME